MTLPHSIREALVESLDNYFEALGGEPDAEAASAYTIELLEEHGDEEGIDDIILTLEDEGGLDGSLQTVIEEEISSNAEFECTGEEIVSLLERLCGLEWENAEGDDDDDDDDDDDFF